MLFRMGNAFDLLSLVEVSCKRGMFEEIENFCFLLACFSQFKCDLETIKMSITGSRHSEPISLAFLVPAPLYGKSNQIKRIQLECFTFTFSHGITVKITLIYLRFGLIQLNSVS